MHMPSQATVAKLLPPFLLRSRRQPAADAQPPAVPARTLDDAERMPCGWFDSSFDLVEGLEVSEERDVVLYQLWSQALSRKALAH